jgi:hypothetical protein
LINERPTRHTLAAMKSKKRHENQTGYTLTQPQTCSGKQDHFTASRPQLLS